MLLWIICKKCQEPFLSMPSFVALVNLQKYQVVFRRTNRISQKYQVVFQLIICQELLGHNCQNNWGVVVQNNQSIIITGLFRQRFQHTFQFYRDYFDCDGFSGGNRSDQTVTNWTQLFFASLLKLFDPLPLCHCLLSPFVEGKLGQELLCRLPIVRSCSHRFWGSRSRRAG